jgi:hypothetical protein
MRREQPTNPVRDAAAAELYNLSNPQDVYIPDDNGVLKFTGEGSTDLLIKSPFGYIPIARTLKTVMYQGYKLTLANGMSLIGADDHIVLTPFDGELRLKELIPGQHVLTEQGASEVVSVEPLEDVFEEMYDFEVDHPRHLYYTNGIISHNTTIIAAYLLWFTCFKSEKYVLVASKDNDAALDVMGRIRFGYEELPNWIKPGCIYFNRHEISFDNNSTIKSSATTENTGRGRSVSLLMIDELAFVNRLIQDAMWASLAPTLSTGGACIISSTPNGDQDLFARLWREASAGLSTFATVFAPWYEHPERDESYKQEMIVKVGLLKFNQEYGCEFLSSDPLLISSLKLEEMKAVEPLFVDNGVKFWEEIKPNETYLVGMDVAEGLGKDYGTIEVFNSRLHQVAEFRNNRLSEAKLYDKLKELLKYIIKHKRDGKPPEIMWSFENNSCGKVISTLYYNDMKFPEEAELISVGEKLGMNTNYATKSEASKDFKRLVEQPNGMLLRSGDLITELKNYSQIGKGGTYEAKPGATDDLVSGSLIVTRLFKYVTSYNDDAFNKLYRGGETDEDSSEEDTMEPMPIGFL